MTLRYPLRYEKEIIKSSKATGVRAELIASVIKVESGFNADAVSNKGAVGLMQLMPQTAKWCAHLNGEDYSSALLYNPEYNIKIGSYYLAYLIDKFGSERTAIMAYNAGEGNVRRWQAQKLNRIPFPETENYLKKVEYSTQIYKAIMN